MQRIDASFVEAKVVDDKTVRNWTYKGLVRNSMSPIAAPEMEEHPVAFYVEVTEPIPAPFGSLNL
jgi:hypothetical protein